MPTGKTKVVMHMVYNNSLNHIKTTFWEKPISYNVLSKNDAKV